jgi:hypothetical protein
MHPITSVTELFAEIALALLTFFVATSTSLAAVTFVPLTELFVNRHYGFNPFHQKMPTPRSDSLEKGT